jgi:hypothetical protein
LIRQGTRLRKDFSKPRDYSSAGDNDLPAQATLLGGVSMNSNFRKFSFLLVGALFFMACPNSPENPTVPPVDPAGNAAPFVYYTFPADLASGVALNARISATFSEEMDPASIGAGTFTLSQGATSIIGTWSYSGSTASFTPGANLIGNTVYTATLTTGAFSVSGAPLAGGLSWSFTTGTTVSAGPAPVLLGVAGNFAILSKSGVDTVPTSMVTGDIGVSPAAATYLTGFSLALDASNRFSTSSQIIGKAYAADYAPPTPAKMTRAVSDMELAYTDAAGRAIPDFVNLGAGNISGLTLVPGLYKWGTGLMMATDVTLQGGPNDVWIFQISGDVTIGPGTKIILAGGALPKNIFWQSYGAVALDTTAHLEGIVLSQTEITLSTGASANGRLLSQTAVTIDKCSIVQPAP